MLVAAESPISVLHRLTDHTQRSPRQHRTRHWTIAAHYLFLFHLLIPHPVPYSPPRFSIRSVGANKVPVTPRYLPGSDQREDFTCLKHGGLQSQYVVVSTVGLAVKGSRFRVPGSGSRV
eukprot:417704-Rhodomonas_salina.2